MAQRRALNRQGESRFICTDGAAATHSIWKDKIGNGRDRDDQDGQKSFIFEDPLARQQREKQHLTMLQNAYK